MVNGLAIGLLALQPGLLGNGYIPSSGTVIEINGVGTDSAETFGVGTIAYPITIQGSATESSAFAGVGTISLTQSITGAATPSDEMTGSGTTAVSLNVQGSATASIELAGVGTTSITTLSIQGSGSPSDEAAGVGIVQTGTILTIQGSATQSDEVFGAGVASAIADIQGIGTPTAEIAGSGTVIRVVNITGAGTSSEEVAGVGTATYISYEAESVALFARFSGSYVSAELIAKDALIAALKGYSLWSTIDTLKIAAGSKNSSDALLNWKGTSYNSTVTGTLTYYTERGFAGFSTSNYLTDGFTPSSAGGNFAQNSATLAVYNLGDGQSSNVAIGGNSASNATHSQIVLRNTSNQVAITNNAGSTQTISAANTAYTAAGLTTNTRTASNAIAAYKGSASVATGATASTGNLTVQHHSGNQNNNGTPATADANLCLAVEVKASGWNATQVANFNSALNTYLQTLKKSSYTFTYSSDGDGNGLFNWLGTNANTQPWANPAYTASNPTSDISYNNNAHILLSASGYGAGTVGLLTDRATGNFQTTNATGSWVKADTGSFRALSCNRYSIRHSTITTNFLRSWKLQGSNDNTGWTDLDIRTNDTTIAASSAWGTFTPNQGVTTAFRWFRILLTGVDSSSQNIIALGEWELYGTLTIGTPTTFAHSGLNGDQAGIIYYLACTASALNWPNGWVNPHASGAITISASTVGSGNVSLLCDRITGLLQTTNASNSSIQIDFGAGRTTRVDSYLIRNANVSTNLLRNWSLQGSTDGSSWTDLDIRTSDSTITTNSQFYHLTCNQGNTSFWRYIRFLQTNTNSSGANSLTLGDIELYGAIA